MALITATDFEKMGLLAALAPVAWLAPESAWEPVSRAVAAATGRLLPGRRRHETERLPPFLARLMGTTQAGAAGRLVAGSDYEALATLREHLGGWRPRIELVGEAHLSAAQAEGRGAILWVGEFVTASLVVKMAMAWSGFRVHHLSRPDHGFSGSAFGRRFLNPIETSTERRYLAERIILPPEEAFGSLRTLRRRLAEGRIVSITVGRNAAQTVTVPFIEGYLCLARGPVMLARAAGAPLLPVFTLRRGPGDYEVRIEAALGSAASREDETPFREYADLLSAYVRRAPDAWRGWQTGGWQANLG